MKSLIPELHSQDSRITVGRFTYGDPQLLVWAQHERISIGSFCSIANESVIFGGGEHLTRWVTTFPLRIAFGDELAMKDGHPASKGATVIENDVWVGFRATILSGVTVGNGAVIGAGAVVSSDVPPFAIVAGNPASIIRYRFSADIIKRLETVRWWEWELPRIRANVSLLCSSNIETFLAANEEKS